MKIISIDIETNGLCPGINSMISLGAVAVDYSKFGTDEFLCGRFKINLLPLEGMKEDEDTMKWWKSFPNALILATENAVHADVAMKQFGKWVRNFDLPVAAYWKPDFDGAFIRYYNYRCLGYHLFGRSNSGLDIKSLTSSALRIPFDKMKVGDVPREWTMTQDEHNHDSLDDATEQAHILGHALTELDIIQLYGTAELQGSSNN